jgi:hypothetical protein
MGDNKKPLAPPSIGFGVKTIKENTGESREEKIRKAVSEAMGYSKKDINQGYQNR